MSPTGPRYPGTVVDGGGGSGAWTSPANAEVSDGVYASGNISGGGSSTNDLNATNFGFNIPPTAVIDGIYVEFQRYGTNAQTLNVNIIKGGVSAGTTKLGTDVWPGAEAWIGYGGASDLWGTTWAPSDINATGFGFGFIASNTHGGGSAFVDAMRITVYWHMAPAVVSKRYLYQVVSASGQPLGLIPNVISEFAYGYDINSAGTNLQIEVGLSADVSLQAPAVITDETGATITDESSNPITTEGVIPPVGLGLSQLSQIIKNGNQVQITEVSYYHPNGVVVFTGDISRWEASFGGDSAQDTIKIMLISNGQDLDNYIARGAPFAYTVDQGQLSISSSVVVDNGTGAGNGFDMYGQTFTVGVGVTNVAAIMVGLGAINYVSNVTLNLYATPYSTTPLATSSQLLSALGPSQTLFAFIAPVAVTPGQTYFFSVSIDSGEQAALYYQNTNVYSGGQMYAANYAGGAGGGAWVPVASQDLYFQTYSGTGTTLGTYTGVDPATGFVEPIMTDYQLRGGTVQYTSSSIVASGLSITYTLNTNTIYEAIQAALTIAPATYYYTVDLATNVLTFKPLSSTPDFTLTFGKHMLNFDLIATIENIKNQVFLTGGQVGGVNLYAQYQNAASIAAYGVRLDRQSNDRITDLPTASAFGKADIAENKSEQYQTTVTIVDGSMDTSLLRPGHVIGFNGFGCFVDFLTMQVVHIDYSPSSVTLTLGVLPKRLSMVIEQVNRSLIAAQTVANPSTPS